MQVSLIQVQTKDKDEAYKTNTKFVFVIYSEVRILVFSDGKVTLELQISVSNVYSDLLDFFKCPVVCFTKACKCKVVVCP